MKLAAQPDISQITPYLYVAANPVLTVDELARLNIQLVISMIGDLRPPELFNQPPTRLLWVRTFDSFVSPIPMEGLVSAAQEALDVIQSGGSVLTYCRQGRHRSVVMAACILIVKGYSASEAMQLLRSQRAIARPQTWYIQQRILQFEACWQAGRNTDSLRAGERYAEFMTRLLFRVFRV